MSVTITEIEQRLREVEGLKPLPGPMPGTVALLYKTEHYVNPDDNRHHLLIIVKLEEGGEYIKVMAPMALKARGRHVDEVLKACMMIQWETKLVQFEYDATDGEIRPIVEWPVEDGVVTSTQLARAVSGLALIVDRFHSVLMTAAKRGKVDLTLAGL